MTPEWSIEKIENADDAYRIHWHARLRSRVQIPDADGNPYTPIVGAYGVVDVFNLVMSPSTTEAEVIQLTKDAINARDLKLDADGNLIRPTSGKDTAQTDAIEAKLAAQAEKLAKPKRDPIELPWNNPAPAPTPVRNKKSGAN